MRYCFHSSVKCRSTNFMLVDCERFQSATCHGFVNCEGSAMRPIGRTPPFANTDYRLLKTDYYAPSLPLQFQPVPDAMHGLNPSWFLRVFLDFGAEAGDVVVYSAGGGEGGVAPDNIQEP